MLNDDFITLTIAKQKNIALIAHDSKKAEMIDWCCANREILSHHFLCGTGTTARMVTDATDLPVKGYNSGPLGGDQQIGAKIVEGRIDLVIFFSDPLTAQPHDPDVKALLRIAQVYDIPIANNRATADFILQSKLMNEEDIAEYIKYDTETPEKFSAYDKMINEDGTFANDRKGIKQVALLMKLKITNNGDEDFQFLSNGFRLYCFRYNEQDDATYYSTIESRQSYLNIHDDHEIFRHHLTIKPGETKEVVAMEVIPYEFVTSYTRTTANVGGQYIDTYKDITTDGLTIDSLYTCYSTTDKAFPVGSPIVKLDIDK